MIRMPWSDATAPNLTIEVTDACNISCRVCYKRKRPGFRSLAEVERDLDTAMKLRPLHTITISGGEPTLHPDLCRIVQLVKSRGVHVFLLSNGLLTNGEYLAKLRRSGVDSILFHVDTGQSRPDLPPQPCFADVRARLEELTRQAAGVGLDVSIAMTLYEDADGVLPACNELFFDLPDLTFLFLARGVDPVVLHASDTAVSTTSPSTMEFLREFYRARYGIEPFAYIPAGGHADTVWISYFVPIIYDKGERTIIKIHSNLLDSWTMRIPKIFSGRFIHKTTQKPGLTLFRTLLNSLSTLRLGTVAGLVRRMRSPTAVLRHKMIVYDDGPSIAADGRMVRCQYCPTAIVRDGQIVACCEADYGPQNGGRP